MTTCDILIKKLGNKGISTEQKLGTLNELDKEIKIYESGDFKKFKSPIGRCFRYFHKFYSQNSTNQPAQGNPSK